MERGAISQKLVLCHLIGKLNLYLILIPKYSAKISSPIEEGLLIVGSQVVHESYDNGPDRPSDLVIQD